MTQRGLGLALTDEAETREWASSKEDRCWDMGDAGYTYHQGTTFLWGKSFSDLVHGRMFIGGEDLWKISSFVSALLFLRSWLCYSACRLGRPLDAPRVLRRYQPLSKACWEDWRKMEGNVQAIVETV